MHLSRLLLFERIRSDARLNQLRYLRLDSNGERRLSIYQQPPFRPNNFGDFFNEFNGLALLWKTSFFTLRAPASFESSPPRERAGHRSRYKNHVTRRRVIPALESLYLRVFLQREKLLTLGPMSIVWPSWSSPQTFLNSLSRPSSGAIRNLPETRLCRSPTPRKTRGKHSRTFSKRST